MFRKLLLSALTALLLAACAAKPSFEPARLVHAVQPVYPPQLEEEGISGTVKLRVMVEANGKPSSVEIVSASHPLFGRSAADTVRQSYTFVPAKRNGQPVRQSYTFTLRFKAP